ncbi:hypothetical protein THIOSC15_3110001 [uncultured Thiomicrorhabdus sp.]
MIAMQGNAPGASNIETYWVAAASGTTVKDGSPTNQPCPALDSSFTLADVAADIAIYMTYAPSGASIPVMMHHYRQMRD